MDVQTVLASYENDGFYFEGAQAFVEPGWRDNFNLAMDAQPQLVTTPSGGIPAFLTTMIDPQILKIRQAENVASKIFEEVRKGTWETETALFPVIEHTGNTTSYGDFEQGGDTDANMNFEARQPYLFQTTLQYGDLALARAALAKIGYAAELREAAAETLGKQENLIYFKGVQGLQNYGIQTDPGLLPSIAPAPKANGGLTWLINGISPNATPNEIYADIQANVFNLINQSDGNIDTDSEMVMVLSPNRCGAITAANSFAVNTMKLITDNFPRLRIQKAIQYGVISTQNTQGVATGEMMQMIALRPGGQETGWVAYNEKLRAHRLVPDMSSFKQKMTSGAYGAVNRQLFAFSTMIGI